METLNLKEKWPEYRAILKNKYPDLSDEDLEYEIGKEVELLKRLQEKVGKNEKEIFDWLHIMG
jgi:hypothetical protein